MPLFTWSGEPDFWSGFTEEDWAAYVWAAMTAGQDQDEPGTGDPPA